MDQPNVELIVRLTARVSAASFAAALILFVAGYQHDQRRLRIGTRLLAAFIVAHTIHFGTVAWLAVVTGGEIIRQRDSWTVVLTVALLVSRTASPLHKSRSAAPGWQGTTTENTGSI